MTALFENRQWAVTRDGIERINPGPAPYVIEAHRLLERIGVGQGKLYDWPIHMARKSWVDIEAFIEAFGEAVRLHAGRYQGEVDPDILEASISEARRDAAKWADLQMPADEAQFNLGKQTEAPRYPEKEPPQYPEKEHPRSPEKKPPR